MIPQGAENAQTLREVLEEGGVPVTWPVKVSA
jgi:hypothetical protein